jgi:hypothetical protein
VFCIDIIFLLVSASFQDLLGYHVKSILQAVPAYYYVLPLDVSFLLRGVYTCASSIPCFHELCTDDDNGVGNISR